MPKPNGKWIAAGIVLVAVVIAFALVYMAGDRKSESEVTGLIRQTPPEGAKPMTDNAFDEQGRLRGRAGGSPGEDSMIPWAFVSDVSDYLVGHYHPAGTRENPTGKAVFTLGYKQLNMRYGLEMSFFGHDGDDVPGARQQIFEYVFRPGMLTALHTLYAETFVRNLALKATQAEREFALPDGSYEVRPLSEGEVKECLGMVAGFLREGGRVLSVMASNERVMAMLPEYELASQGVNKAFAEFNVQRDSAGQDQDKAGEAIKKAIQSREALRQAVVGSVRRDAGRLSMPDDSIFYLVQWGFRRTAGGEGRTQALSVAGKLLNDVASRLLLVATQGTEPGKA